MSRGAVRMSPLSFSLVVLCLFHWIVMQVSGCEKDQYKRSDGKCCNMCPPGKYIKSFCTKDNQTVCSSCEEGHFSSQYSVFDRCEKCQQCHQNSTQKCTATTNTKCSCQHGFLCSTSLCSRCVKNECSTGEILKQTQRQTEDGVEEYSYVCEPTSPASRTISGTQPSHLAGNHNSWWIWVHVGIGFIVVCVILLLLLAYSCLTKWTRHKSRDTAIGNPAIAAKPADFQLSQEESGHSLILQDTSNDKEYLVQLNLEKV